jgi:outer membrane protein assembly factor BamB
VLLLLAGLAGCGGSSHRGVVSSTTTTPTTTGQHPAGASLPRPTHLVTVRVVDGDTGLTLADAVVRVPGARRSGRDSFGWRRPASLLATVSAPQYATSRVLLGAAPSVTVRLYQPAAQWLMYGVTPARTQDQGAIPLRPPFRIAWGRSLGALLEFPAVVDDGVAYLSNAVGELFALSMRNGHVLWRYDMHTSQEASSPAVVGNRLVAHSKSGEILVLDRASGRLEWSAQTASEIESSPVVAGGVDYLADWSGNIYALDLRTRRFRWVYHDGCKITASVTIHAGTLYVGDYCGRLLGLGLASGRLRFSVSAGSPVYGASAYAAGRVFTPSRDAGALYAFTASGRYLWDVSTGDTVYSAPAVWDGRVFFGSYSGELYSVSQASGHVLWELDTGGRISGSPTVVDGVVYVGNFSHEIVGASARTGKVLFRFPHGEYVAVSGNRGRLLLYGWATLWAVEPRR